MEIIDKSGQPRMDEDIQEAIEAVGQIMAKQPLVLPLFTIHAGIILDGLRELQRYRKIIAEARKAKQEKEAKNGDKCQS